MSRQNVSVEIFGRHGWNLIHNMAATEDSQVKDFLLTLPYVLPCSGCRDHLGDLYDEHPVPNSGFKQYTYMIHDKVNKSIGKVSPSYEEYLKTERPKPIWHFIHSVTFGYPEKYDPEISPHFMKFFQTINKFVPGLQKEDFQSRTRLIKVVFEIHKKISPSMIDFNTFNMYYKKFIV